MPVQLGEIALLALLGVAVGTYGTLVGVGGGFLIVPLLLLVYNLSPPAAAATSLVVVLLNATSGSISYLRLGRVDIRTGLMLAAATVPGALVGPFIATLIPDRTFRIAFAVFLIGMSGFLLLRPERREVTEASSARPGRFRVQRRFEVKDGTSFDYSYNVPLALSLSLGVGVLSSVLGIGGGIVHVPMLIHLMSFPVHIATATSQFVLAITAVASVATYSAKGHVEWPLALSIGVGVVVGAQIGAALSQRLAGRGIVRLLMVAVVLLAGRLLWTALRP